MSTERDDDIAVGIDLGTSNSCVAVLRDGKTEVLTNAYGEGVTASVVALAEDGSVVVGNAARANLVHDPENTVNSSKRLMGRYYFSEEVKKAQAICSYEICEGPNHGVRIRVRDETFSPAEIAAMTLRELRRVAETQLGQPVTKAVITVPANFNDNQRQATKDAGRIAGLDVLRILNEPTAAALSYGFGRGLSQKVAVYDLGGGTFDISVLEIGRDVFEVLSTCGDTFLGGDDFDDRIIDLLADEFVEKHGVNLRNDRFALEKLKVAAENAKKAFSVDEEAEIRIPDIVAATEERPGLSVEHKITADEFEKLVADLVQRTFKVCDEALQQADVVARDLDGVILVGGPTQLPLVRRAVKTYFQQEPLTDVDPDQVVAMGAAIQASMLTNSERDAFLLDVTPLSLRIGVAGGLAEPIIERNTPVPIEQTRSFTTFQDNQEVVVIRVYQGEARTADENELLGQFEFSGFRKARRGEVTIDVTFVIDADGIVGVTARDPETGHEASTRITLSSGLSEQEVSDIIEQRRTDRVRSAAPEGTAIGGVDLVSRPIASDAVPTPREAVAAPPSSPAAPSHAVTEPILGDDEEPTGEYVALPDSEPDLELLGEDELGLANAPDPLDEQAGPLASEAPTDELRVYDDGLEEDIDLLPNLETDLAPATGAAEAGTPDTEPKGNLFEPVGTDLSELPGDLPEDA